MDADDLLQLMAARRSVRRYAARRPDRSAIERLVRAACWAPSNHNRQGWKFVVFEDGDEIAGLARRVRESVAATLAAARRLAPGQADEVLHFAGAFDQAPVVILVMHKRSPALGRALLAAAGTPLVSGEALSAAMAVQNLLLAAHASGMGACVMTAPLLAAGVWAALPDLPPGFEPNCLVTLGYAAEQPPAPPRKDLDHVLEFRPAAPTAP
jgi:nitroreductase